MEAVFYVMAIMGCSDGAANCAETRIEPAHYSTIQQCQAAMAGALQRNSDLSYPVISAACRASGDQFAQLRAQKRG